MRCRSIGGSVMPPRQHPPRKSSRRLRHDPPPHTHVTAEYSVGVAMLTGMWAKADMAPAASVFPVSGCRDVGGVLAAGPPGEVGGPERTGRARPPCGGPR